MSPLQDGNEGHHECLVPIPSDRVAAAGASPPALGQKMKVNTLIISVKTRRAHVEPSDRRSEGRSPSRQWPGTRGVGGGRGAVPATGAWKREWLVPPGPSVNSQESSSLCQGVCSLRGPCFQRGGSSPTHPNLPPAPRTQGRLSGHSNILQVMIQPPPAPAGHSDPIFTLIKLVQKTRLQEGANEMCFMR